MKLDAKEIAAAISKPEESITPRGIKKKAKRESWPYEEVPVRGGRKRLYPVAKIPNMEIRRKLMADNPYKNPYKTADGSGGSATFNSTPAIKGKYNPADIPEHRQVLGRARADLVEAYLAERNEAEHKGLPIGKTMDAWLDDFNAGKILKIVGNKIRKVKNSPVTRRQIYDWIDRYKRDGWTALCGYRRPYNKWQSSVTEEEGKLLLAILLNPNRIRIWEACRQVKETMSEMDMHPKSEKTYYRWVKQWEEHNNHLWVAAREGEKALRDKVVWYIERDIEALNVGDVVVADGHVLNCLTINPYTGKAKRMMLVMFYDMKSRMPLGWEIMPTETVQSIHSALFNAIMTLGKIPKAIILDNGRAFKSKVFTGPMKGIDLTQEGIQGTYADLGITVHFAWPYNARAKTIERFFCTFNEFERLMDTYTGRSIIDKPAPMLRNEKRMKALYPSEKVFSVDETNQLIATWLQKKYATRPHRGLAGRTPLEVFLEGKGPGVDAKKLAAKMLVKQSATVRNCMIERFGLKYRCDELMNIGGKVEIRYTFADLTKLYVFQDGYYIGLAEVNRKYPVLAKGQDRESLKHAIREQRHAIKETFAELEETVGEARGLVDEIGFKPLGSMSQEELDKDVNVSPHATNLDGYFGSIADRLPDIVQVAQHMSDMNKAQALPAADNSINNEAKEVKQEGKVKAPIFEFPYERYEWLLEQRAIRSLTDDDERYIEEFEADARKSPALRECFGL